MLYQFIIQWLLFRVKQDLELGVGGKNTPILWPGVFKPCQQTQKSGNTQLLSYFKKAANLARLINSVSWIQKPRDFSRKKTNTKFRLKPSYSHQHIAKEPCTLTLEAVHPNRMQCPGNSAGNKEFWVIHYICLEVMPVEQAARASVGSSLNMQVPLQCGQVQSTISPTGMDSPGIEASGCGPPPWIFSNKPSWLIGRAGG